MKKIIKYLISALAALTCCMCVFGCTEAENEVYSETFVGKICEESYESSEEAAKAFLSEEIGGNTTAPVFLNYSAKGEIAEEELAALDIPEAVRTKIERAEKGEVTYREGTLSKSVDRETESPTLSYELYVFKIGNMFKYYVPAPANGGILTKSYCESVFDLSKYENLTIKSKATSKALDPTGTKESDVNMEMTYKVTAEAVAIDMTMVVSQGSASSTATADIYVVQGDGGLRCFVKSGSG